MVTLLASLSALGPFSIDTYLPAFEGIARSTGATPAQLQQTLAAYLFGFAFMNLFHGSLSDALGRRPVVLTGLAVFTLASVGCALAQSIEMLMAMRALQGLSTGAGMVVSRAIIRDLFAPADAQRVMSRVTIIFGVAPAIAPMIGGWLYVHSDWHAVFWFLSAVGLGIWLAVFRGLPETLKPQNRQPFEVANLMRGYRQMFLSPQFLLLCLASGVPFNGMFLYVLSSPVYLGEILRIPPEHFFWFFIINILGIMGGAWLSGRLAGRIPARRQIRHGLIIMVLSSVVNVVANLVLTPDARWSMLPIAVYSFGWSLMVPAVTLMVLDLFPDRRGMASSLQAVVGSAANGLVAGVISPLVMHSALGLAVASAGLMLLGLLSWLWLRHRFPETPGVRSQRFGGSV